MGSEVNNMIKVFYEENDCILNPWAEIHTSNGTRPKGRSVIFLYREVEIVLAVVVGVGVGEMSIVPDPVDP